MTCAEGNDIRGRFLFWSEHIFFAEPKSRTEVLVPTEVHGILLSEAKFVSWLISVKEGLLTASIVQRRSLQVEETARILFRHCSNQCANLEV